MNPFTSTSSDFLDIATEEKYNLTDLTYTANIGKEKKIIYEKTKNFSKALNV